MMVRIVPTCGASWAEEEPRNTHHLFRQLCSGPIHIIIERLAIEVGENRDYGER